MTYHYDDNPELYRQARKRLQNKMSAQYSRFGRIKQAEIAKHAEEELREKFSSLQRELAEKEKQLTELQRSQQAEESQPAAFLEFEDVPLPTKRCKNGHSTLDEEIIVPVRQS